MASAAASGRVGRARRSGREPGAEVRVDLELELGGQRGRVVELREGGALVEIGSVRTEIPYGSDVRIDGRVTRLTAPSAQGGDGAPSALEAALRAWRAQRAAAQHVPAYVVMHDAHLRAVAEQAPSTMAELARCPGMGPVRLDRYGDEILAVIEGHG
jgi:superfamily II DNA helicase RecQ